MLILFQHIIRPGLSLEFWERFHDVESKIAQADDVTIAQALQGFP